MSELVSEVVDGRDAALREAGLRGRAVAGIVMAVAAAVFIALVVYASPTYRGSDQYWYVEDVTTILAGKAPVSHETYPFEYAGAAAAGSGLESAKTGFVHNGPALYAWAGAAALLGSVHTGIIAVNILAALLTALLVYLASLRFAPRREAALFGLLILFLPVAYWSAAQDLAETFSAVFLALALYLVARFPKHLLAYAGAQACIAGAAVGRLWVAALLLVVPLAYAILRRDESLVRRIAAAGGLMVFGLLVFRGLLGLMPYYGPSFNAMAALQVSRSATNMVLWFDVLPAEAFSLVGFIGGFVQNVTGVVRQQLMLSGSVLLEGSLPLTIAYQVPTVLLALVAGLGLLFGSRSDRLRNVFAALGVVSFAGYIGFLALFQDLSRYAVPFLPAIVLGAGAGVVSLGARERGGRMLRTVASVMLVGALVGSVAVDTYVSVLARPKALNQAAARSRADALVREYVPADARVVLDTRFISRWVVDQALYPREVFALSTDYTFTRSQYDAWFARFKPTYIVTDESSTLPTVYDLRSVVSRDGISIYAVSDGF